ncbi:HlyC/CorC family transporter [Candidatus Microgenomates bacterium]|nr:HlyC/CorC family transporter [Candidatus Microgenomates bacterium]
MEIAFIIFLVLLNGVFAMAEIAILASRKNRLQQLAARGQRGAQTALDLLSQPSEFLSSVQVGITLISVLLGALGEPSLGRSIRPFIESIPGVGVYHEPLTFLIVITIITFISLFVGELVPKRIAVSSPERIASMMAPFISGLALVTAPFVTLLSRATDWVISVLHLKQSNDTSVTEEEVRMLIREGSRIGIFNKTETDLVERALRLDDVKVNSLMKPRNAIKCIDVNKFSKKPMDFLKRHPFDHIILCEKNLDHLVGVIYIKDLLQLLAQNQKADIKKVIQKPQMVPESMRVLRVLELFRNSTMRLSFVIDEYGNIQGLVTFNDILQALVGEIMSKEKNGDPDVVKRSDGSLLLDGMISIQDLKKLLQLPSLPI